MTIMDDKDYIRALLYSYYTTTTGWGSSQTIFLTEGALASGSLGSKTLNPKHEHEGPWELRRPRAEWSPPIPGGARVLGFRG